MKVHPSPERSVTVGYGGRKGLKRLLHVFSSVLQLPFPSDAHVAVEETSDCFKFVAGVSRSVRDVRAQIMEIHPGLVKVVIREATVVVGSDDLDLELDVWRFRLPASTRPELATAACAGGELVVRVPKEGKLGIGSGMIGGGEDGDEDGFWGGGSARLIGDLGRLVLVQ